MKQIAIVLYEGAWAGSITLPLEILQTALIFQKRQQEQSQFEITLVGLKKEAINSFSQLSISPQCAFDDTDISYDAILLPATWTIDDDFLNKHAPLSSWLIKQYNQGTHFYCFLTGTYLLAQTGLINHRQATTHWHYADDFRARFPSVNLMAEKIRTSDKHIHCCGGVNASLDLTLDLIQNLCGNLIAQQCERHCLMGTRRDYQHFNIDTSVYKKHNNSRILAIQHWLEEHYAEPIALAEISARFGFSTRNLTRKFKETTGLTLQIYTQQYRLEVAKHLLIGSEQSIQEICFNVGYESLTVFGRRFKAYTKLSASLYRQQHKNITA